jgi:enoyl-CoA hydratase/carnithine racemase
MTDASSELVRLEPGPVAVLTLNRPDRRNALSGEMLDAIREALDRLNAGREARCILLRGEGDHFCAGADFSDISAGAAAGARYGGGFEAVLRALEEHPLPIVCEVRGAALGAGCQLLAAADLSVASTDAQIGIPSPRIGILLDLEKIQRMISIIGAAHVREMLLTGRAVGGEEAARWGLVTKAVQPEDVATAAREMAEAVAANAPLSVQGSKAAIREILSHGALSRSAHAGVFAAHDEASVRALTSADTREGLAAMKERRTPRFTGA